MVEEQENSDTEPMDRLAVSSYPPMPFPRLMNVLRRTALLPRQRTDTTVRFRSHVNHVRLLTAARPTGSMMSASMSLYSL